MTTPGEDFDVFFRKESRSVLGLALVLCGSRETAEDLTQDAFAAAHRNWAKVGGYDDPGAWVRRAVANRAVSVRRRLGVEARALFRLSGRRPEDEILRPEDADLWRAVRELPRRQAQVIALVFLEDLDIREAASILGCSESTAKTHVRRARAALAVKLGTDGKEDS
ncbi:MAG: putative polymerase subfamily sigma factor [Actinomycetia bacterium]|nr:putative polymerase subfamily sigma factor [Actinomycetes bacterium]